MNTLKIPADVPGHAHQTYISNYTKITRGTGRLFLFSADQKIEHLNADFIQPHAAADAQNPEHIFKIAQHGSIGALATQFGLISHYGTDYPTIPYIVKLNSKTNLIPQSSQDPYSAQLNSVHDAVKLAHHANLSICGVGYTLYLGSSYESQMLHEAAQVVTQAHAHGLVAILWMYPRGAHVQDERDPELIAGAAGVAVCLGADFAKIHAPKADNQTAYAAALAQAVQAAGRTKLIISGGTRVEPQKFLDSLHTNLNLGVAGCAVGRNIFQHNLADAVALTKAISALVYDKVNLAQAEQLLQ